MLQNIMGASGFQQEEIASVLEALGYLYEFARSGANGEKLDAAVRKLQGNAKLAPFTPPLSSEVSFERMYQEQTLGDPGWFFHLDVDYDPVPAYRRVRAPGLVLFGKHDFTVPVEESVARIQGTLDETGNRRVKVRVLANIGHGVLEVDPQNPRGFLTPVRFAEGYRELLVDWLRRLLR